jgi:hypothetical protein
MRPPQLRKNEGGKNVMLGNNYLPEAPKGQSERVRNDSTETTRDVSYLLDLSKPVDVVINPDLDPTQLKLAPMRTFQSLPAEPIIQYKHKYRDHDVIRKTTNKKRTPINMWVAVKDGKVAHGKKQAETLQKRSRYMCSHPGCYKVFEFPLF